MRTDTFVQGAPKLAHRHWTLWKYRCPYEDVRGRWMYSSTILDLGARWRWVVSFFPSGKQPPGTHSIRGWVGPRTYLGDVQSRKMLPHRDPNSDPSVVQPVASRSLYRLSHHCRLHMSFEAHNAYDRSSPSQKYSQLPNEVFTTE
jgi:hypothetical protein